MRRAFRHFEAFIILPAIILFAFSLVVIGSISAELVKNQFFFLIVGTIIFILSSLFLDRQILTNLSWPLYLLSLLLLLATFFGPDIRGAHRWIEFLGIRLQPSELIKPLLIVAQAAFLDYYSLKSFRKVIVFLLLFILPALLVFRQPDLGNGIVYVGTTLGILFMAGLPMRYFVALFFLTILFFPFSWGMLKEYQRSRLISFLNPYLYARGAGYNAIQAMIAVGSGQLFGRGLGRGSQSQLRFLPERHTDFIFASISEELGFFGASIIILAYFVLLFTLFRQAKASNGRFSRLVIFAVLIQLFLQIFINIGMNLGILPITGITLPFISYGGSSIIATSILLGFCQALREDKVRRTIAIG